MKRARRPKPSETRSREESGGAARQRRSGVVAAGFAVAALAAVAAYEPALRSPFVFDDLLLPFTDPNAPRMPLRAWVSGVRPLLMFTFWLNYRVSELEPFSYHLLNLAFHFGAASLVFLIVRRLLAWEGVPDWPREPLAAFAGGLFLLHPLQTEAVSYVASRSENLSVLFAYAAFAVFLHRRREEVSWAEAVLVLALFAAAVSTKEHTAALPALLLLTDLHYRQGSFWDAVRRNARLYAPMAVAAAAAGAFVWRVLRASETAGFAVEGLPWHKYFFTQCKVIWVYLRMFVLPFGQNIDHGYPPVASPADAWALAGLAALVAVSVAAWRWRRTCRLAGFGWFAFLVLIAPTSSLVPIADPLAERRVYLPSLGLLLMVAAGLLRWQTARVKLVAALAAVLALAGLFTHQRNLVWTSSTALWEDSVQKNPRNWRAHFQLAHAYYQQQRCAEALRHYAKVAELGKPDARLLINWALAYDCAGRTGEALDKLGQALELERTAHLYATIGMVRAKRGEFAQALAALETAEQLDPKFAMLYVYRGHVFAALGRDDAAIEQYRRALSYEPGLAAAREALLAAQRRLVESQTR